MIPPQSLGGLFLRFLRFGCLAWGGPVAQIDMIRRELVEQEGWIPPERFNRALAVYQVLPGPEAHELCVYFGMLARGRPGAVVAGLGFMLPGFVLMFALSWWYVAHGLSVPGFAAVFHGLQAAVAALIVRAVYRIGRHALTDRWLLGIAVVAMVAQLRGAHFAITLGVAGLACAVARGGWEGRGAWLFPLPVTFSPAVALVAIPGMAALFFSGLRSGLLTFGGAYTVIPFLQHDAVVVGAWMTNDQFLDGLALSSILPAPLVIFATFVGYLGGGPVGALVLTAGVFLPAFAFTLIGHATFERLMDRRSIHSLLDGITAGVVGLIAASAVGLFRAAVSDVSSAVIFAGALAAVSLWSSRAAVPLVVLAAGLIGLAI